MSDSNRTKDEGTTVGEVTPVYAEELVAETHTEQVGTVHVHKDVVEEPRTVTAEVTHDEMTVERTPINQEVSDPSTGAFQQTDIEIPLQAETLTASKRVLETEEVTLHKKQVTEQEDVTGTVRREQVSVDAPVTADAVVSEASNTGISAAAVPPVSGTVEASSTTTAASTPVSASSEKPVVLSDGEGRAAQPGAVRGSISTTGGTQANVTAPAGASFDEMDSGTPVASPETTPVSTPTSTTASVAASTATTPGVTPSAQGGTDGSRQWKDEPEETILIKAGTPTGDEPATERAEFVAGEDDARNKGASGGADAASKAKGAAQNVGTEVAGAASTLGERIGGVVDKITGRNKDAQ